ncbi:MAG: hypothetical protein J5510_07570 [Prevotella sp.]|nr:hypothetical protein [Prevotella sp.]
MADIKNGAVTISGLDALDKKLAQLKTDSPGFEKRLRDAIRKILGKARANLQNDAASGLRMGSDPRKAYKAVRFAVYKRIFGGQVNILQPRKAGKGHLYEPPRTLRPGQRGGNRVLRTRRTTDLMSYDGKDRGFILRFLNQGTGDRAIHQMGNRALRTGSVSILATKSLGGNRGSISPRNWFNGASMREMQNVAGEMQQLIDKIIKEEFI